MAAIYLILAAMAMILTRVGGGISLIWPANAMAAALLIRFQTLRWVSAGIALSVACMLANLTVGQRSWALSLGFTCSNLLEMALMVWSFRHLVRFRYPSITVEQAAVMTAVSGVAIPGLTSFPSGVLLHALMGSSLSAAVLDWWSSHAIGACLIGPPVILYSSKSLQRLLSARFRLQNVATLLIVLVGCFLGIRYVRFPFVAIGVLLLTAAFRVGGFGASLLGLLSGLTIAALWSLGLRPAGIERVPIVASLASLPVLALLATTMPAIAVGLGTDARRNVVRRLNLSERRFRESMEHSPIGMVICDLGGRWRYTNLALQTMLGYSSEEFLAMAAGGPAGLEEWETGAPRRQRLLTGEISAYDIERCFRHKDGHEVWTHVAVSLVRDEDGKPQHLIAQIESLEARRRAEANLAAERRRLEITLSTIADAVITTDVDTRITYINAAGEKLLGQAITDIEGRRLEEVISLTDPTTSKAAADLMSRSRVHGTVFRREVVCVLHRPDGLVCYVRDVVSPVLDPQGIVTGLIVVLQEASADFERARAVSHRASHDPLTGLANRFEFEQRLREAFRRARHTQMPAAIVAIDLDRFKAVNDTGGHAAGDAMLQRVAEALRGLSLRRSDTIGRLGGDEFGIVLEQCSEARSTQVAQQVLQALNPLKLDWDGGSYEIGASVGVAMMKTGFDTEAAWIAAADAACYRAKREGRGQLRID